MTVASGTKCVGRLAPSPTGALHLGNARTFLLAWLSIRFEARWRIRHRLPYALFPATPVAAPAARGSRRWLLPLAIGLWIGGAWGGDG